MRLLILLSALLAGLTGMIAGQPAIAHRGEQAAVVSSAAATAEQVHEVGIDSASHTTLDVAVPRIGVAWRLHPSISPRGERRLE